MKNSILKTTFNDIKITKEIDKTSITLEECFDYFEYKSIDKFGKPFIPLEEDFPVFVKLLAYFLEDVEMAKTLNIDLEKGILINGGVGAGKTYSSCLMRFIAPKERKFIIKSCRHLTFDFAQENNDIIYQYGRKFSERKGSDPLVYLFDDLGAEKIIKHYGNEYNLMAEIIQSRYDLFISEGLITHLTTNLNGDEIENAYGTRVRSRMREMFNVISFTDGAQDKRK